MEPAPIHHLAPRDAEFALERARADAEWLASLRSAYRGRHDVLDALWWVAHPHTATPSGLTDPADGLRELQRAVFSRAAAESPVIEVDNPDGVGVLRIREAEHRLREAERVLAEDSRCLDQAWLVVHPAAINPVAAVVPGTAGKIVVPPLIEASSHLHRAPDPTQETAGEVQLDDTGLTEPDAEPRRKLLIPVVAGIGLLAAILVLPTLPGLNAGIGGEPTPAPTTPSTTPHTRTEIVTIVSDGNVSDPLSVLLRPEAESDKPRFGMELNHEPGSFRRLPDLVGNVELYVARGEEANTICLVAVREDGVGMSSCVPEATYLKQGIQLGSSGNQYQAGHLMILTESFTLLPNGDFHYQATARASLTRTDSDIAPVAEERFLGS